MGSTSSLYAPVCRKIPLSLFLVFCCCYSSTPSTPTSAMPPKRGNKAAAAKKAAKDAKPSAEPETNGVAQEETMAEEAPTEDSKAEEPATTGAEDVIDEQQSEPLSEEKSETTKTATESKPSKKRKQPAEKPEPRKGSRRSGRSDAKGEPSKSQLLKYMLSKPCADLTRPDDEEEDLNSRCDVRTYSNTPLNPFEELLCAVILSRPISHRLGLRTIRTILNAPYNFNGAKALKDAGDEKRLKSVYDARTQHKDKTAAQMGTMADAVLDNFTASDDKDGTQMGKLLADSGDDMDKASSALKEHIKGLGMTGLEIFFRRVQWLWTSAYPNIDGRTADSLRVLGLPQDGQELVDLIKKHWKDVKSSDLAGKDEEEKRRRAFVLILERATGAQLEHKIDAVLGAAAGAT